jgi:adenosylmethionine-8-amino-7-oxononanoate aminotransferase
VKPAVASSRETDYWDRIASLDRAHVVHPISDLRRRDARGIEFFVRGRGLEIELADGRRLIDGFSGLLNVNVGHGRAEIVDAVGEQMRALAYYPSFWNFGSEAAARLAGKIAEHLPSDRELHHFMFHTSGSEANEANFKIARLYHALRGKPGKTKILSRRWSFHGSTRAAGSATGIGLYHQLIDQDPAHAHFAAPYCYRCEFGLDRSSCRLECAFDLLTALDREDSERVAAVIVEPVMGTGGILPPPSGYFEELQRIARDRDVLLILDEVITGFGRTGRWFGMERWHIRPDLLSLGKGITSGYAPLSASVMSESVHETLRAKMPAGLPFMLGSTYNNHPSSCAAALANIEVLERERLPENASRVGDYLLRRLGEAFGSSPLTGEIRGVGLMAGVEVVRNRSTKQPFPSPSLTHWIAARAFDRGLVVRPMLQCIGIAPPLTTTESDVDRILGILRDVWNEAEERFTDGITKEMRQQ